MKQLQLLGEKKLSRPRTTKSIEKQVVVLEKKVISLIVEGNSTQRIFALNGKIQKLKHQLVERNKMEYLAK